MMTSFLHIAFVTNIRPKLDYFTTKISCPDDAPSYSYTYIKSKKKYATWEFHRV